MDAPEVHIPGAESTDVEMGEARKSVDAKGTESTSAAGVPEEDGRPPEGKSQGLKFIEYELSSNFQFLHLIPSLNCTSNDMDGLYGIS